MNQDLGDDGYGMGLKNEGGAGTGLGDLAGLTEIGTINVGESRRNSFRGAAAGRSGSESKERMREPSSVTNHAFGNIPRPTTSNVGVSGGIGIGGGSNYDNLSLRRP